MTGRRRVLAAWAAALFATASTSASATDQDSRSPARADSSTVAPAARGPVDPREFAPFIDELIESEMAESGIPGAVFLMVRDGEVFYARGYGFANLASLTPVDPDRTVFRVGSNSKSLTAAAVLSLVDEGVLDLDVDVNEYLVQARVPATYAEPITLRHLLTHTAGFDERLFGQHARSRDEALPLGPYLDRALPPRTSPPGRVISYNDFGTSLAGLVVEDVTGRPFAEYAAARIFHPLGMDMTSFDVRNLPSRIRDRLAVGYRHWNGEYTPYAYDYIQTAPAAGLVTTARDMGRFLLALLEGGRSGSGRILSDSMTAVMLSRQFAHSPRLRGRAFGFVESDENGVRALSKDGQATGFLSRIFLIPEARIGFFSSINLSIFDPGPSFNRASGFHRRVTTAILDRYFMPDSGYFEQPAAPSPDPAFDPSPYVGTYRAKEGSRHTIEKLLFLGNETTVKAGDDGVLLIGSTPYVQLDSGEFQYAGGGPYWAAFERASRRRATHLFLGAGAFERVAWYDTARSATVVVVTTAALCASVILAWPVALLRRRGSGISPESTHPGIWVLLSSAVLALLFLMGFGWTFSHADLQDFFKGIPASIGVLLALPVVVVPLTIVAIIASARAWRRRRGSVVARLHYSIVCAGLVAFLLLLANWHMLGWQY